MREIQLELTGPDVQAERLPPRLTVHADSGIATGGPHVVLERGQEIELTLDELQWLRDVGIPGAVAKLTEITATRPLRQED